MAHKYYFMFVNPKSDPVPSEQIEEKIKDLEWLRFRGANLYLLYTEKSSLEIRNLIQPLLKENDHILVGEFNKSNHSGWLSTIAVDWLNKAHEPREGT